MLHVAPDNVAICCVDMLRSFGRGFATCQRNIVGRNMLHAFGHPVAICCDMLGVVGSSLKMVKFEPTTPNISQQGAKRR